MTLPPRPITVIALGCEVVCVSCGAVWARLSDVTSAFALARAMNGDPYLSIPDEIRVQRGVCHGTGTRVQWPDQAPTVGTPADWAERLVVAEEPPEPPGRPAWGTAALTVAVVGQYVGSLPGALARGLSSGVFWSFAFAGAVLFLLIKARGVTLAALTFGLTAVVVVTVTGLVTAVSLLLWREYVTRPRAARTRQETESRSER